MVRLGSAVVAMSLVALVGCTIDEEPADTEASAIETIATEVTINDPPPSRSSDTIREEPPPTLEPRPEERDLELRGELAAHFQPAISAWPSRFLAQDSRPILFRARWERDIGPHGDFYRSSWTLTTQYVGERLPPTIVVEQSLFDGEAGPNGCAGLTGRESAIVLVLGDSAQVYADGADTIVRLLRDGGGKMPYLTPTSNVDEYQWHMGPPVRQADLIQQVSTK